MQINVIAMLTNNDQTVENAVGVFEDNHNGNVKCWGFKDVSINVDDTAKLAAKMKAEGKKTFFEPLVEDEGECLKAAKLAVDCKFDYLIGMVFHQSVLDLLQKHGVKYFPTCGKRAGHPRMLYGTPDEIIKDAKYIEDCGADGICLSVYRYAEGDPEEMAKLFVEAVKLPCIVSGGINSDHRLDFIKELRPWGFTIGSALFKESFGFNETIFNKLNYIKEYLGKSN